MDLKLETLAIDGLELGDNFYDATQQKTLLDSEAKIAQARDDSSILQDIQATSEIYLDNTLVGYNSKQLFGETKQSEDEFVAQDGYVVEPQTALNMALQVGGDERMADALREAKSPEHLSYLFAYHNKQIAQQKLINDTFTPTQQAWVTGVSSVFDWDTLFSFGLSAIPKVARGIGTVSRATAMASAVGFTKPFVRDYLQEADTTVIDRILEGTVGGLIEGASVKYFSPEIKQAIDGATSTIPSKAGINAIAESSKSNLEAMTFKGDLTPKIKDTIPQQKAMVTEGSIENQVIKEYSDLSVEELSAKIGSKENEYTTMVKQELDAHLANNSQLLAKDKEFMKHMNNGDYESALTRADEFSQTLKAPDTSFAIQRPKEFDAEAEVLDMVEAQVAKEIGDKFNKELFNAELTIQVENKTNFFNMMNDLKRYVQENNILTDKAKLAVTEAKKMVDGLLDDASSLVKLTAKEKKAYAVLFKDELDDFLTLSKQSSARTIKDRVTEFVDSLKTNKAKFLDNVSKKVSTELKLLTDEISMLTKEIKELEKNGGKGIKTRVSKVEKLNKKKTKIEDIELARIEQELLSASDKLKVTREGDKLKIGKYKIPLALGVTALGSNAFAEGEGDAVISGVFALALVLGGTAVTFEALKATRKTKLGKQFTTLLDGTESKVANLDATAKAHKKTLELVKDSHDMVRTGLTETYAPLMRYAMKSGNLKLKNLVENLLFNGTKGEQAVAEITKSQIIHVEIPRYIKEEAEAFAEWRKANGITTMGRMKDFLMAESTIGRFREYVAMYQAGLDNLIPEEGLEAVKKMASNSKSMKERVLNQAKELGVEGTDSMKMVDNYLTRKYNPRVRDLILGANSTTEGKTALRNCFETMYKSGVQRIKNDASIVSKKLQKVVDGFEDMTAVAKFIEDNASKFSKVLDSDSEITDVFESFKNSKTVDEAKLNYAKFAKEIDALDSMKTVSRKVETYLDRMTTDGFINETADIFGSLKYRIPLDLKSFQNFSANINGELVDVKINGLFDLDDFALTERYVSSLAGRIGIKNAGFQISEINALIKDLPSNEKTVIENVMNVLTGKPTYMLTTNEAKFMQGVSNVASARLLVTSPVSLIMEATMAFSRMMKYNKEGRKLLNDIFTSTQKMGEDSMLLRAFADDMGFGVGSKMGGANIRGEALDMFDSDLRFSKPLNYTRMMRDVVMNNRFTGISYWSDKIEMTNLSMNTQRLADIAYGRTKISDLWMNKYGISQKDYSFIQSVLKYNDKGYVKYPDVSKLNTKDRLRLHNILFNMNQYGAQRSTLGGTPHWAYASSVGSLFIKLLSYSVNSVSNLGAPQLKGVLRGDVDAYLGMTSVFVGGYLSAKARDAILNRKEKTEEEYFKYAVMQIPILAPLSLGMAISNPTASGGIEALTNDLGNMSSFVATGNF